MSEQNFTNPNESLIQYIKRGVLWVQKKPVYIIELINEKDTAYIAAYAVQEENIDPKAPPIKRGRFEVKPTTQFSKTTTLSKLADTIYSKSKKAVRAWKSDPPIFVCPVVHNQQDTFSGKIGSGFFEHTQDRWTTLNGQRKYERGAPTGVFIGLDSIVWEDKVTIPADSFVKAFAAEGASTFYDLTGEDKNENPDNPLGGAYRG